VWEDERALGVVSVSDTLRPEAPDAVARLAAIGVGVEMVSGDRSVAAETTARAAGIERVRAEVFPADKIARVRELREAGHGVAFVGDGINDAPALAEATVGIALGSGTDVALEAADIRLLAADLGLVPDTIELSRRTYRVIQENLFWAFAYNMVMIPLAVLGVLTPVWAAFAMAASSLSVVANALRLKRFRRHTRGTVP